MTAAGVICISRADGAEGEEVGRLVAGRLGFRYVDDEILISAAAKEELWPEELAEAEQRRGWLDVFARGGTPAETLRSLIREAILETADEGRVVIVAHAASFALTGREHLLRVLVTASPETRAHRLAEADGIDVREAARVIGESDKGRADYLRRFYEVDRELPIHYDLIVNTDYLTPDRVAQLVIQAAVPT